MSRYRTKFNEDYGDGYACWFTWMTRSKYGVVFSGEGLTLLNSWKGIGGAYDGQLSGILADWMKENRDNLIFGGNPAQDIDDVIEGLMKRMGSLSHNYRGEEEQYAI